MIIDPRAMENDLIVYERGRQLRSVVNSPVWEIVIDTLRAYKDQAEDECFALSPGDQRVLTAHAAASALRDQFVKFQQDINNAVEFAANPPEEFALWLSGAIDAADVMKQQERAS